LTALFTAALIARSSSTRIGVDGYSDFNALHSGRHNEEVQFSAFDVLAMDGDDLRYLSLSMWKANLARLLARRPDGIFLSDFECEIGPDLFVAACRMGLEGLVSKHRHRPYRVDQSTGSRSKNRKHPAMELTLGYHRRRGCLADRILANGSFAHRIFADWRRLYNRLRMRKVCRQCCSHKCQGCGTDNREFQHRSPPTIESA
jgi:hypothetical protein